MREKDRVWGGDSGGGREGKEGDGVGGHGRERRGRGGAEPGSHTAYRTLGI